MRITRDFDSRNDSTYHEFLMPLSLYAWYSLNTLELLGQRRVQITGEIEFERLTRFRDLLHSPQGSVRVGFKFGQHAAGDTTVRLEYAASFKLQCQRYLEPAGDRVARQISFAEDELIMSLPLIPRHA